jgi:hypothetical protein
LRFTPQNHSRLFAYIRGQYAPRRDTLLLANRENLKALGDFGYAVDESPQAKAKAKPAPV